MKRVLFVLTIILSLISCTTEVTKIVNDEPKKVVHYTVKYKVSYPYDNIPEDFICEKGYILTEEDLPVYTKKYHITTWETPDGIKITKGYKVTSDIVLEPSFEWDTHYQYFYKAGDFYIDHDGKKCSKPKGNLISSTINHVDPYGSPISAYTGGQTTFLLCNYFIGARDFLLPPDDATYDYRDSFCGFFDVKAVGFNQYEIVKTHSLYTSITEIDFSHTYEICMMAGDIYKTYTDSAEYYYTDMNIGTANNLQNSSPILLLIDNTTKKAYIMFINEDGCLYKIREILNPKTNWDTRYIYKGITKFDTISEEWTGEWRVKNNNNAPKIHYVKLNDIIFGTGDRTYCSSDLISHQSINVLPCQKNFPEHLGWWYYESYNNDFHYTFPNENAKIDLDIYEELWYFD
jgi:hypothetical protein